MLINLPTLDRHTRYCDQDGHCYEVEGYAVDRSRGGKRPVVVYRSISGTHMQTMGAYEFLSMVGLDVIDSTPESTVLNTPRLSHDLDVGNRVWISYHRRSFFDEVERYGTVTHDMGNDVFAVRIDGRQVIATYKRRYLHKQM